MATNTTAVAKQVRAFCLESMEQKKTSFVELPTPTESVNTYNSQTAILDNETVAIIHFPSGISVELKQSVPHSLIRTLVEASTYVK